MSGQREPDPKQDPSDQHQRNILNILGGVFLLVPAGAVLLYFGPGISRSFVPWIIGGGVYLIIFNEADVVLYSSEASTTRDVLFGVSIPFSLLILLTIKFSLGRSVAFVLISMAISVFTTGFGVLTTSSIIHISKEPENEEGIGIIAHLRKVRVTSHVVSICVIYVYFSSGLGLFTGELLPSLPTVDFISDQITLLTFTLLCVLLAAYTWEFERGERP